MTKIGNFAMELAEVRVDQERDAGVARARSGLGPASGATHCLGCGSPIPEARQLALPSARHCIDCANRREARGRR